MADGEWQRLHKAGGALGRQSADDNDTKGEAGRSQVNRIGWRVRFAVQTPEQLFTIAIVGQIRAVILADRAQDPAEPCSLVIDAGNRSGDRQHRRGRIGGEAQQRLRRACAKKTRKQNHCADGATDDGEPHG